MKNFVKALDKEGDGIKYLKGKSPRISDNKIKEKIFEGPQIRLVLKDESFNKTLSKIELAAWHSFKNVIERKSRG